LLQITNGPVDTLRRALQGRKDRRAEPGNGLLLFFRLDDSDEALSRARALVRQLEQEPQINSATGTREFALRDLDGYYVMVSALA
jgi:hypothetical protein